MENVWQRIIARADREPDLPAVLDLDGTLLADYQTLITLTQELAQCLRDQRCQTLALHTDNSLHWIIADLACLSANICSVPIPMFFAMDQINHVLKDSGASHMLTASSDVFTNLNCRACCAGLPDSDLVLLSTDDPGSANLPAGTAKLTYTSGSTGTPKGVCLSVGQLSATAIAIADSLSSLSIRRHLSVLPFATLLENIAGIYVPLLRGASICVAPLSTLGFSGSSQFNVQDFLHGIQRSQPNSMVLVPQLLQALLQCAEAGWPVPDSLRFVAVGGGKISQSQLEQAAHLGLPVYEGYGLSECCSVVSLNTPSASRCGSVGKPLAHVKVRIGAGEIVISGSTFLGYSGSEEDVSGNGYATGDLGHIDDDGFLYIDGRKKNLLISTFGRNISPEWIESELLAIRGVRQAMVVGDNRPYCSALLYLDSTIDTGQVQDAIDDLNRRLPDYAVIRQWQALPHPFSAEAQTLTANGRLRREAIINSRAGLIESLYDSAHTQAQTDSAWLKTA